MNDVQKFHEVLLQRRTQIRNHKSTLQWMRKHWKLQHRADSKVMSLSEYKDLYSILLYEMTICWEEELNDAILAKM
uniref:Uncharacterized protein n=1 Tax=Globisporangium ultimum (strain ATCC 200006 / CBS 805.95 / DAOM BR144) TaxID=431595 RepID=K3X5Z7_GLOUD